MSPETKKDNPAVWTIVASKDGKEISRTVVARDKMFIGRLAQNHIVLNSGQVSRSHAMLTYVLGRFFISDQGSQNGTLLNGRSVLRDEWKPGDILTLGPFSLKIVPTVDSNGKKDDNRFTTRTPAEGDTTLDEGDSGLTQRSPKKL